MRAQRSPSPDSRAQLVEAGRKGQKTKAGWYDYSAGRKPVDERDWGALWSEYVAMRRASERTDSGRVSERSSTRTY